MTPLRQTRTRWYSLTDRDTSREKIVGLFVRPCYFLSCAIFARGFRAESMVACPAFHCLSVLRNSSYSLNVFGLGGYNPSIASPFSTRVLMYASNRSCS